MQWLCRNYLIIIWIIISTAIELASQSEILIIRHGRSRSRHSSEKDHVRWGLKAFDNLTIVAESDIGKVNHESFLESAENETSSNNDLNVANFYDSNGTLNQSSELVGTIGSYEINYTINPSKYDGTIFDRNADRNVKTHPHQEWQHHDKNFISTTEIPKSALTSIQPSFVTVAAVGITNVKRRNGPKKKEIMTNIKNTVNKGIQYLKSHEDLDEIKIEINDFNTKSSRDETKRTAKSNKIRSQSITKTDQMPPMYYKQQQHKSHSIKQIKINGGKDFSIVTISKSDTIARNKIIASPTTMLKSKKSTNEKSIAMQSQQWHAVSKHIKNHQVHNEIDMNINSNLADIFYVPSSTEGNPYNDEQMSNDEPAGKAGNKNQITKTLMENSNQHDLNTKKPNRIQNHEIYSTVASSMPVKTIGKLNALQSQSTAAQSFSVVSDSTNKSGNMHIDKSVAKTNEERHASHKSPIPVRLLPTSKPNEHDDNQQNDEEINNDAQNEDFMGAIGIQNDENSNENSVDFENDPDDDENEKYNGIYHVEDFNLNDYDETSRNNRKNLMRGRDVVTRFLQIVESQHVLGGNCTAGTALNLGEGVVDRYAQDRFKIEAEVAVNRANMLTRIFKMTPPTVQENINLLHASVLSMVEFDDDIFAAGHCFDWNQYPAKKGLFCPFAHRLPAPEIASFAKDLANEYHYLGNTSEWFFLARKNAEKVIAKNEQYIKAYHSYPNDNERHAEEILSVKYEDGRWSKPYYDCGGGNIWMLTYTVPFFGYENGTYFFKGTSGIDIDLRRVDIDQCAQKNVAGTSAQPLNIFAGTDKCKQRTTECIPIPGLGFRRGSYKCICRRGFFFPDVKSEFKYFNGSALEEEYAKLMQSEASFYNDAKAYECLPCAEGCDSCEDASPCVAELNWPMRTSVLILACAIIGFLPPAAVFTHRYQQVKVVKAASPALLRVIAMGAFLIYCTTIVMYPNPSLYTCVAKIWLREIGFSLTYGALMLKTWRISVIFRVRSAKAVKITDASLIKKLGLLCGFVSVALLIRTLVSPPDVIVGRTADNLKAFLCKTDWWDHTFTSLEVLFLAWGVRLCIVVRKAPSEFNESRFISMAIYNEFLLTCFLNVSMLFLQSPANPDLLYIIFFCHTQLTVTLLLALIFGSKVYLVFRNGGKTLEDSMHNKSAAAKFISRSQARTYASASSVNASTGQLHYPNGADNNRLSENEALEEIKQLAKQLQSLYDRTPQRGPTTNVILTLLDICRTAQNANNPQLTLRPPVQSFEHPQKQQQQHSKQLSICNGHNITVSASCGVDKETNTSFDNLVWQQINDANCRSMISDKCDTNNHLDNSEGEASSNVPYKSKCCEANNTICCSTNSINFDNLQLQCMCSSDNNSLDESQYQIEKCDKNLSSATSKAYPEVPCIESKNSKCQASLQASSFRERLLHFANVGVTRSDDVRSNNLTKRNSELVLGTNFEPHPLSLYKGSQSYRLSKTFDSCDNIYPNKQHPPPGNSSESTTVINKSNQSLSTESDQKSIPYSFLERPTMKLSQSDDRNLRELKIALSSTLPAANISSNSHVNQAHKHQLIGNLKTSQPITQSQSGTSSTSSSKIDKISLTLSTSSTSDNITKRQSHSHHHNHRQTCSRSTQGDIENKQHQQDTTKPGDINNQNNNKNEDNKMIMTEETSKHVDNKTSSNVNNNSINSGKSSNGKKRKSPEGKLTIDLNDRSKYTEEVSV